MIYWLPYIKYARANKFAMGWPQTISGEKMDTRIEKQNLPHSKLEKEEDILEKICLCKQNGIEMKIEKICHSLQIEYHSAKWTNDWPISKNSFSKQ